MSYGFLSKNQYSFEKPKKGFTLIEVLVGVVILVSIFGALSASLELSKLLKRSRYRAQATLIANSALEALRPLPFSQLTDRTNDSLLNFPYNIGQAEVIADPTAPTSPNALYLRQSTSTIDNLGGLVLAPFGAYATGTFSASFKILSSSPASWESGFVFDFQDTQNHYRVRVGANNLYLDKIVNAMVTTLDSAPVSLNKNVWYTLRLERPIIAGTSTVFLNDVEVAASGDATFSSGVWGIATWGQTASYFDNIATGGATEFFDSVTPKSIPADWQRHGLVDLPEGRGYLTIADWNGLANTKQITVRVDWRETDAIRSVSASTVLGAF